MKRNQSIFPAVLLALALSLTPSPSAPAQESEEAADNQPTPAMSATEIDAKLSEAVKTVYPDATIAGTQKGESAGTNDIYTVRFTVQGTNLIAQATSHGILLKTEEPGDITKFPQPANDALRKAITAMGTKDNGVRLTRTYAEITKDESGASIVVKLDEPRVAYGANVANNLGKTGKFTFDADGAPLERPAWAK